MRFSEDRLSHWAHLIYDRLWKDNLVDYPDEARSLNGLKDALHKFFHIEDEIDTRVMQKIQSQKRNIAQGSPEWDILYQKYFVEEYQKLGR